MKPVKLPAFVKKKSFAAAVVIGILALCVPVVLADEPVTIGIKSNSAIWLNGKQLQTADQPVVIGDNVYVPLRSLGEALGKEVDWNEQDGLITVTDAPVAYAWKNSNMGIGIK